MWYYSVCVQATIILLVMAPKHKSSGCWEFEYDKKGCKLLPLREKRKGSELNEERKNHTLRLQRSTVRMTVLSMKLLRRKMKFILVLLSHLKQEKL